MTCRNRNCKNGLVEVVILLDSMQEIHAMKDLKMRSHTRTAKVPCPYCCGARLHQAGIDRVRVAG